MDKTLEVKEFIDQHLIFVLPAIILILVILKKLFKDRYEVSKTLNLIRWIIVGFAIIGIVTTTIGLIIEPDKYAITSRATGPYKYAYWLMFFGATIVPLTLLSKKLSSKWLYLLFVSVAIKIGAYMEMFVIIVSSFYRDYSRTGQSWSLFPLETFLVYIIQSVILSVALLTIATGYSKSFRKH